MVDFFNKFYELEMKICAKEARRLKSKIEFRRLMEKMKKRFWTSWRSTKSTVIFEEVVVDLVEEFARLGKALKWKIYYFIGFSAQASTLGVFKHASGLGSTNLQIFRFNFPTETTLSITYLLKNSEISTLFGSSPVLHYRNTCG